MQERSTHLGIKCKHTIKKATSRPIKIRFMLLQRNLRKYISLQNLQRVLGALEMKLKYLLFRLALSMMDHI